MQETAALWDFDPAFDRFGSSATEAGEASTRARPPIDRLRCFEVDDELGLGAFERAVLPGFVSVTDRPSCAIASSVRIARPTLAKCSLIGDNAAEIPGGGAAIRTITPKVT